MSKGEKCPCGWLMPLCQIDASLEMPAAIARVHAQSSGVYLIVGVSLLCPQCGNEFEQRHEMRGDEVKRTEKAGDLPS